MELSVCAYERFGGAKILLTRKPDNSVFLIKEQLNTGTSNCNILLARDKHLLFSPGWQDNRFANFTLSVIRRRSPVTPYLPYLATARKWHPKSSNKLYWD